MPKDSISRSKDGLPFSCPRQPWFKVTADTAEVPYPVGEREELAHFPEQCYRTEQPLEGEPKRDS